MHPARAPRVADDTTDEEAGAFLDSMRAPDGSVLNIFRVLANNPGLARRWARFGSHVLLESTLPGRERELAILRIGWRCRSEYEWGQHVLFARAEGLTDDEIRRVREGPDESGWSPSERAVLVAADELHETQQLGDEAWTALSSEFSVPQIIDLVFAIGQYTLVSMALNALQVPLDDDLPGFDL